MHRSEALECSTAAPRGWRRGRGRSTDVGVIGYTTGGGLGPMARTYGLAIDKVRAIEVVTGGGMLRGLVHPVEFDRGDDAQHPLAAAQPARPHAGV